MSGESEADTAKTIARDLIEQLRQLAGIDLEEGELYAMRRGLLTHVARSDDDSELKRLRVLPEAYEQTQSIARQLRKVMRGYRPDPTLVASALIVTAAQHQEAPAVVQHYLRELLATPLSASQEDAERG